MKVLEGMLKADGLKLAIVVSRFNEFITNKLLGGAEDAIRRTGGSLDDATLVWVPGAFEIPWRPRNWPNRANMTPSSPWAPSSAVPRPTLTMSARKPPKAWPRLPWVPACRSLSAS